MAIRKLHPLKETYPEVLGTEVVSMAGVRGSTDEADETSSSKGKGEGKGKGGKGDSSKGGSKGKGGKGDSSDMDHPTGDSSKGKGGKGDSSKGGSKGKGGKGDSSDMDHPTGGSSKGKGKGGKGDSSKGGSKGKGGKGDSSDMDHPTGDSSKGKGGKGDSSKGGSEGKGKGKGGSKGKGHSSDYSGGSSKGKGKGGKGGDYSMDHPSVRSPRLSEFPNCYLRVDEFNQESYECSASQDFNFDEQWITLDSTLTCPADSVNNLGLYEASRDDSAGCECSVERSTYLFWALGVADTTEELSCTCHACKATSEVGRRGGFAYECDSPITDQCFSIDCVARCDGGDRAVLPPFTGNQGSSFSTPTTVFIQGTPAPAPASSGEFLTTSPVLVVVSAILCRFLWK